MEGQETPVYYRQILDKQNHSIELTRVPPQQPPSWQRPWQQLLSCWSG